MAKKTGRADGRKTVTFTFNGKRYYCYGGTLREARAAAAEKKAALEKGQYKKGPELTLDEYHERWEEMRFNVVRENTIRKQRYQYKAISETVIDKNGKRFGSMLLKDINRGAILLLRTDLCKRYQSNGVNGIIALLHHILSDAELSEYIEKNPARKIGYIRRTEPQARDTVHRALSAEEKERFFKAAAGSWYYNMFRFLLASGLRVGEAGALTPGDINRKDGMIYIHRTVTSDIDGHLYIGNETKTRKGTRYIEFTDRMRSAVRDQMEINRLVFGSGAIDINERIFRAENGGIIRSGKVSEEIARICAAAGIERFSTHAFRDCFATDAIANGMKPKTLQEVLGHESITTTMNLYCHVLDEDMRSEMRAVSERQIL